MDSSRLPIFFFLPQDFFPKKEIQEAWQEEKLITLEERGLIATAHAWIYQTWVRLRAVGVECDLVTTLPQDGIVITLSIFLTPLFGVFKPLSPSLFVIDVVADGAPHPGAHCHLIQNRGSKKKDPLAFFMPHWPQPNLIPRDPYRGTRLEKIAFFGDPKNLAPLLQTEEWTLQLRQQLGIHFEIVPASQWHDYSSVDVAIAIRAFSHTPWSQKPATKLYNAWLAGVPFIGGYDAAYALEGNLGKNYLRATSPRNLLKILGQLKENPTLFKNLIEGGAQASTLVTPYAICEQWLFFLQNIVPELREKKRTPPKKKRWSLWPFRTT